MKHTPLSQRLWRWHFLAGLIICPFAILLSITGGIYLFKPQIDQFIEMDINSRASRVVTSDVVASDVATSGIVKSDTALDAHTLLLQLLASKPDSQLKRYILAKPASNSIEDNSIELELVDSQGQLTLYWMDIYTGEVLHSVASDKTFLHQVKKIHSELLLGNKGSYLVELMACWLIIIIITGLYLWLEKRGVSLSFKQLIFPPVRKDKKAIHNLHGAIGLWFALPILLLLLSGLPWTQLWGSSFKNLQQVLGLPSPGQEWFINLQSSKPSTSSSLSRELIEEASLWEITSPESSKTPTTARATVESNTSISDIQQTITPLNLAPPVQIQPPKSNNGVWTVRAMSQLRSERVTLHYDQHTGEEIMRIEFKDHNGLQRIASQGVSLHEGALFGWLNQLLGLMAALAVTAISLFGLIMWWRRRPQGELGLPDKGNEPFPKGLKVIIAITGLLLPAAGISFIAIIVIDAICQFSKKRLHNKRYPADST